MSSGNDLGWNGKAILCLGCKFIIVAAAAAAAVVSFHLVDTIILFFHII